MEKKKITFIATVVFALFTFLLLLLVIGVNEAFKISLLGSLIFGVIFYILVNSIALSQQSNFEIRPDDDPPLYTGGANHIYCGESVGGKLYLFPDKLTFKSHQFNIKNHELHIGLKQIEGIKPYNNIGIIPNGLLIITNDGKKEKFIVNGRKKWIQSILQILKSG